MFQTIPGRLGPGTQRCPLSRARPTPCGHRWTQATAAMTMTILCVFLVQYSKDEGDGAYCMRLEERRGHMIHVELHSEPRITAIVHAQAASDSRVQGFPKTAVAEYNTEMELKPTWPTYCRHLEVDSNLSPRRPESAPGARHIDTRFAKSLKIRLAQVKK